MSKSLTTTSKTQFIIAIDDDESDDTEDGVSDDIDESVAQTLRSLLDVIESEGNSVVRSVASEVTTHSTGRTLDGDEVLVGDRVVKTVEDLKDVGDLEVNVYYNESRDSDNDILCDVIDDDDLEAEDCMVIDDIEFDNELSEPMVTEEDKAIEDNPPNEDSDDGSDDIECVEERLWNRGREEKAMPDEEVIELSDDDEECVIIDDSFSAKPNESNAFGRSVRLKRSSSPVYSSDSYIPLSQPSTSSGYSRPTGAVRRGTDIFGRSADSNRSASASLRDLFRSGVDSSAFGEASHVGSSTSGKQTDDSIPFLYDDPKPSTSCDSIGSSNVEDIDLIAQCVQLDRRVVQNVVNLIEDQCTVPFIVRYRQAVISGIDAEKVRRINSIYSDLKTARERAREVEQTLRKSNRLNPRLREALKRCKNVFEVEHLYRLCRNESEASEKYRNLGLTDSAIGVLEGKRLDANHFVNQFAIDLDSADAIRQGWSAIISDIISKDCDVLEFLIAAYKQHIPTLQVVVAVDKVKQLRADKNPKSIDLIRKYLRFDSFKKPINKINAHTYMAIERGEKLGLLNVYVEFETVILNKLIEYCLSKWNRCVPHFLVNCVRISFNNQLKPSLQDYIRWELRHSAHMTALDVFRNNVKHLLLEPPLTGEYVMGVDPGFQSGCKIAIVSPWGVPLKCKVVKLDSPSLCDTASALIKNLLLEFQCSIIALGNGTGCRRFEQLLCNKIDSEFFRPLYVKYKIINESGVSWYSVTNEAKADLPHFPPHMIGAISIARRLIDPLSELVKVDPKRLQVGMYMRDIDEEAVKRAFHEVAVECVSFCGVDVNVASIELLSKIAGLEPFIARLIRDKRERDGLFTSRSQLKTIDGIGWKQFEQCAGFIKIMPTTSRTPYPSTALNSDKEISNKRFASSSTGDYDPLDSTIIHPESYSCANTYIELMGATKQEVGKQSIRQKIASAYHTYSLPEIAQLCNTDPTIMKLIIEGLSRSIDFDYRTNFAQIYRPEIQHFDELKEGMNLKGRVTNVTPMGAFIDCGISGGINAYLSAKECDRHGLAVNDNVLLAIASIDRKLQRFQVTVLKVYKTNVKFT